VEEILMDNVKAELRKILLIGKEGMGKTNFIKTMPKPIYVFSFDGGYRTLAGEKGIKVGVFRDKERKTPKAYREFMQKIGLLERGEKFKWDDGKEEPYQTIAIDSLTFLSMYMFDSVQKDSNNVDKKASFTEWQLIKSFSEDVINRCVNIAQYVVCTSMVMTEKDELTGEIFFVPDMYGKVRDEIGGWFDAVFYMEIDKTADGEINYKMVTVGGRKHRAKLRVPSNLRKLIGAVEEQDFGKLMEKIQKGGSSGVITPVKK
jgi:phage nucleotide-binding protein